MPFLPALAILFIALKLTGVIAWSWWLVLLPLYPLFFLLAVMAFAAGGWTFATTYQALAKRKRRKARA